MSTEILMTAAGVAGYLLGSINTSILVGRMYGMDIRKQGSGNAGATNTLRTLGKKAAVLVLAGDILKGVFACLAGYFAFQAAGFPQAELSLGMMTGGTGAVIGHNWPLYFGFRGGKGILTSFAVVLMVDWRIGLISLGIFLAMLLATRYVSAGSILAAAGMSVLFLLPFFGHPPKVMVLAALLGILAIWRHQPNIRRLLAGTEARWDRKGKKA
ncbi:MAG TPA: acyl-phosphate glycerol 3-phosphate acyltransferase [Clostridiales bacterium]|nr:acyl-phosphate glycerol 3-phosphate acyltransferase [Clostridiales bacterium]